LPVSKKNMAIQKYQKLHPLTLWPFRPRLLRHVADEIIFRTNHPGNRLILELMARGGMRVGEVLKLKVKNVHG
jgi:integrase